MPNPPPSTSTIRRALRHSIQWLPVFILLTVICGWPRSARAASLANTVTTTRAPAIDTSPALQTGDYSVSHYLVEKYHRRFADGFAREHGGPPPAAEDDAWFRLFFAQQLIIAEAGRSGYFNRPEVRKIVDRMERHMLTKASGPLYEQLYREETEPVLPLEAQYRRSFHRTDAYVVSLREDPACVAVLGENFSQLPLAEQTRRVTECREAQAAEFHDGPMSWPYFPFFEIADLIESVPLGHWVRVPSSAAPPAACYLFVRASQAGAPGDFAAARERFAAVAERHRQQKVQIRRQRQLLMEAAFRLDVSAARGLAAICRDLPKDAGRIPEPASNRGQAPLFQYRVGEDLITVTVADYIRRFNDQIVRQVPRDPVRLRENAEDMVVEELDYRAARRRGLDRAPQFTEDRHGFAGFQVLALYEREILAPKLAIGQSEIERYYRAHDAEFRRVSRVRVRISSFATLDLARAWMAHSASGARTEGPSSAPRPATTEDVEIPADHPRSGFEPLQQRLLQSSAGTNLGPLVQGDTVLVVTKLGNSETRVTPLAEAIETIRDGLTRRALETREQELAQNLATRSRIETDNRYLRYLPERALASRR